MIEVELLNSTELPQEFKYPKAVIKLIELGMVNYEVWYFFDKYSLRERYVSFTQ